MGILLSLLFSCEHADQVFETSEVVNMWWDLGKTDVNFYLEAASVPDQPGVTEFSGIVWLDYVGGPTQCLEDNQVGGVWERIDDDTFWVDDQTYTHSEITIHADRKVDTDCYKVSVNLFVSDVACPLELDDYFLIDGKCTSSDL